MSALWSVYIGQNGANITAVMAEDKLTTLQQLIARGQPFTFFIRQDGGKRLTQLTVAPAQGGVTLHVSPPVRIPLAADGSVAQNQQQVANWLEPDKQPQGELKPLSWGIFQTGAVPEHIEPEHKPAPGPV